MELRAYLKVLKARRMLVIACVVVVTLGAVGYSLLQKPVYEGVAMVLVTEGDTGLTVLGTPQAQTSYTPGRDIVQTQVEVIESERIAQQVVGDLRLHETAASLLSRVTVSADTGTNNISITAQDSTPGGAADIANGFANAYVAWSRNSQSSSIRAAANDVQKRLADAQASIASIQATATSSDADQTRLLAARSLYTTLADKLEQLRIAEQLVQGAGTVLSSAMPNPVPVSPKPARNAALGLAVGLLLGLGAAFIAEQLDVRIRSAAEASTIYGAPVLAHIPTENVSKVDLARLTLADRPGSPAAEAYRMLRNNLDFVNFDKNIKTILVTSAVPGEGKSTVAANLAAVLARTGANVVLVVCDFYLPAAERFFDIDYSAGLSNLLAGTTTLSDALKSPPSVANLSIIPAGPVPPNASELLSSEAMRKLVHALRESADWVILDSAPVLAAADSAALTRWVDGVLVVARVASTARDAAAAGREQLTNVGARVLGVAVIGTLETATDVGFYGYHTSTEH